MTIIFDNVVIVFKRLSYCWFFGILLWFPNKYMYFDPYNG